MKMNFTPLQRYDINAAARCRGIQKKPFDYTKWHDCLFQGMTVREISKQAMEYRKSLNASQNAVKTF